jgi:nucleotide-binding universal stress UspA family protein
MYRTLLVPLDGSRFSEQALPLALSIAKRAGAELQLLYVHGTLEADYPEHRFLDEESWTTEWKTRHEAYLDGLAQRLRAAGAKSTAPLILQGDIAGTIRKHAIEKQVDLVVMTTHARGPVARMWLGSVADQLIRELPTPLLLVHPIGEKTDLTADVILKHLLLPLDGTPLAELIIEPALALGELMGTDYTLLRVIRPVAPIHYPPEGVIKDPLPEGMIQQLQRVETASRRKAQEYLDEVAQRLRRHLLRVHTKIVDEAQPALAVIEAAQKLSADLIAMQTHGWRGLHRLLLGSVADKVLRAARAPLLVQRPPSRASAPVPHEAEVSLKPAIV